MLSAVYDPLLKYTTLTLFGAPGPTEITVASGRGLEVAEEGRKMPVAVFLGGVTPFVS